MKEIEALPEDAALMIILDPEALPGVQPSETLFQFFENVMIERRNNAIPRFFAELKIHLLPPARAVGGAPAKVAGWFQPRIASRIAANTGQGRVNV